MQNNVINLSNNKIHSDLVGHLGAGNGGLYGSQPEQRKIMTEKGTPKHGHRYLLTRMGLD